MKTWRPILWMLLGIGLASSLATVFMLWRGFQAVDAPTVFETVIARSVRNFAIPLRERSRKNPLQGDAEALTQGRELFLSRCATCHGIDGGGKTRIGVHVYPRVPDLRDSPTQNLTDGEIHYIIEYGVRLTAMPALRDAHRESTDDSWKLVLAVRGLRTQSRSESTEQAAAMGTAHYVGSAACERCHVQIYRRWKNTPMANVVRDPRTYPNAVIPDISTNTVSKFTLDKVAFVYGSIWKQRYFTRIGGDYFPLPMQWDVGMRAWLPYHIPSKGADWWTQYYPSDNMKRPTGLTCDGCHSVNYDIRTKEVAEWNVGCERCHGPGSEHVRRPVRGNILNPAHMDSAAANDVCIQCHSQGRPPSSPIEGGYYDWPVGYRVGLRLQDFWKLEDCRLGQTDFYYYPDCTAHKNRMQGNDFVQSVMYRHQITCSSCHDIHGTKNYAQLIEPPERVCLNCHGPTSSNGPRAATLEEHTHHKTGSPGSQCVACHMPAIESEGVPGAYVHAHTFRFITPEMSEKYAIPNPCTSCHTGKSNSWAESAMRRWERDVPWRVR